MKLGSITPYNHTSEMFIEIRSVLFEKSKIQTMRIQKVWAICV